MNHVQGWILTCMICGLLGLTCMSVAQNVSLAANSFPASTAGANGPARQPDQDSVTLPPGTHLLMKLVSPLHTTSSTAGSGAYLETVFPVVANGHVVIPEHTRVMGEVSAEQRPGRTHGRAQLRLQFTQLILPDNRSLSILGNLQSLPGSRTNRTIDRNGTLEPVDQIDADVYTLAGATMSGALLGSIGRPGLGTGIGAAIGGGLGLAKVLFTRGDEISLPAGTRIEMVLRQSLIVQGPFGKNSGCSEPDGVMPGTAATSKQCAEPSQSSKPGASETVHQNPNSSNVASSDASPDEKPRNNLPRNLPCLRDGVTLLCVTSSARSFSSHNNNH